MNARNLHARWGVLLVGLALAAGACAPQPQIPTLMVLPSLTFSPVPTVTPPPTTPVPQLVLPSPTVTLTRTPLPTAPPTPTLAGVLEVSALPERIVTSLHIACAPQTADVRAVLTGPLPGDAQVLLKWDYDGYPTSRPGDLMTRVTPFEFTGTLGPFDRAVDIVYRIVILRGRDQVLSEDYRLAVAECTAGTPVPTLPGMVMSPTPTPTYGAALSVEAVSQNLATDPDVAVQVVLSWRGGVPPYTLDRVMQPRFGTLDGVGPVRVYIPGPGFTGIDRFTFVVTDGNGQASTGTIVLYVGVEPPTAVPG